MNNGNVVLQGGRALTAVLAACLPSLASANALMDLYKLAQRQDPTYLTALHQRDAAVEVHPQALATLLPQVSADDGYNRNRQHDFPMIPGAAGYVDYYNSRTWQVSLSQVVFSWPVYQTLAKSNLQVAQAQATFLAAEQSLIFRVADAFFTVLNAQDTLRADVEAQRAFKRAQDEAQAKYDQGVVAITDVRNAEAAYDSSCATVIADQRAADSAKSALAVIVGLPEAPDAQLRAEAQRVGPLLTGQQEAVNATLRDDIPLSRPDAESEEGWSARAESDNPLLLSYRYAVDMARKDISITEGQALPTLEMVGAVGRNTQSYLGGSDDISDVVGVQLSWKIFQGGLVLSEVRQAVATRAAVASEYEGQLRTVYKSARDSYQGVISGVASIKATQLAVVSSRTSLEATQAGFKVGTRTEVDVLNAQQALATAERNYYQARYDYLRSTLALQQATGHLVENDLVQIDQLLVSQSAAP